MKFKKHTRGEGSCDEDLVGNGPSLRTTFTDKADDERLAFLPKWKLGSIPTAIRSASTRCYKLIL